MRTSSLTPRTEPRACSARSEALSSWSTESFRRRPSPCELRGRLPRFLAFLACVFGAAGAHAAGTFYVDGANSSCSNSGPGSIVVPYCTITAAANARGGAGTTLLVKPAIYREQVTVPFSGASGSPFLIQALGAPVVIDGADDFSIPSRWSLFSGNVYLSSFAVIAPVQVFVDGARLTPSTDAPASLTPGTFRFVGGQGLYVNIGGDSPGTHATFVGRRSNGFRITGRSFVTIDGFMVTRTEDNSISLLSATNNTAVVNNTITLSGNFGILANGCAVVLLGSNVISDSANHGISLSTGTSDSIIEGNESFRNARPGVIAATGIKLDSCSRNIVQRNRLYDNQDTGLQINHSDHTSCFLNRSWNNGDHGFDHLDSHQTIHAGEVAYHNSRDGISIEGGNTDTSLYDSISIDNGGTTGRFNLWVDSSSAGGFASDYNIFWNPTPRFVVKFGTISYLLVSDYSTATGHDGNTLQANSFFMNAAGGDFHLQSGSPAIDSADSSWLPATDAEGHGRVNDPFTPSTGVGPFRYYDRGALEFQPVCGPETCDGIDNDCDDTVDDGNPDGGASCGTTNVGQCEYGVMTCSGGSLGCAGNVEPTTETCDGIDNNCDGTTDNIPASAPATDLTVTPVSGASQIAWAAAAGASAYDVVRGNLTLLQAGGSFTTSTNECLANDSPSTSVSDPDVPFTGDGFWYLVRGVNCGGGGTYDDPQDPAQAASRDASIAASASACP